MMTATHRYLTGVLVAGMYLAIPSAADAGLCDWLFHRNTTQTTFYTPAGTVPAPLAAGTATAVPTAVPSAAPVIPWSVGTALQPAATTQQPVSVGPATCQQTVVQYMPETAFRTVWNPVPVTQYQTTTNINPQTGLPITCTRPCVTYSYQAQRVPYTTFRPVLTQVPVATPASFTGTTAASVPAVGYTPGVTYGAAAPADCQGCGTATSWVPTTGTSVVGATTSSTVVPSPLNTAPFDYSVPSAPSSLDPPGATPWMPRGQATSSQPLDAAGVPPRINLDDAQRIQSQGGPTPESYQSNPSNGFPSSNSTSVPPNSGAARSTTPDSSYSANANTAPVADTSNYRWNEPWTSPNRADTNTVASGSTGSVAGQSGRTGTDGSVSDEPWWRRSLNVDSPTAATSAPPGSSSWSPNPSPASDGDAPVQFRVRPLPESDVPRGSEPRSDSVPSLLDPNDLTAMRQKQNSSRPSSSEPNQTVPIRWTSRAAAASGPTVDPGVRSLGPPRLEVRGDSRSPAPVAPEDAGWVGQ